MFTKSMFLVLSEDVREIKHTFIACVGELPILPAPFLCVPLTFLQVGAPVHRGRICLVHHFILMFVAWHFGLLVGP